AVHRTRATVRAAARAPAAVVLWWPRAAAAPVRPPLETRTDSESAVRFPTARAPGSPAASPSANARPARRSSHRSRLVPNPAHPRRSHTASLPAVCAAHDTVPFFVDAAQAGLAGRSFHSALMASSQAPGWRSAPYTRAISPADL